jgi:hypothetical protein
MHCNRFWPLLMRLQWRQSLQIGHRQLLPPSTGCHGMYFTSLLLDSLALVSDFTHHRNATITQGLSNCCLAGRHANILSCVQQAATHPFFHPRGPNEGYWLTSKPENAIVVHFVDQAETSEISLDLHKLPSGTHRLSKICSVRFERAQLVGSVEINSLLWIETGR